MTQPSDPVAWMLEAKCNCVELQVKTLATIHKPEPDCSFCKGIGYRYPELFDDCACEDPWGTMCDGPPNGKPCTEDCRCHGTNRVPAPEEAMVARLWQVAHAHGDPMYDRIIKALLAVGDKAMGRELDRREWVRWWGSLGPEEAQALASAIRAQEDGG